MVDPVYVFVASIYVVWPTLLIPNSTYLYILHVQAYKKS